MLYVWSIHQEDCGSYGLPTEGWNEADEQFHEFAYRELPIPQWAISKDTMEGGCSFIVRCLTGSKSTHEEEPKM